jgi:type I restriction enzyme S subunit
VNPGPSTPLDPDQPLSFLPMEAIGRNGELRLDQTKTSAEAENGYTYFENGDITIAKITPCFENGKGAVMTGLVGGAGFGTTELIVLRPEDGVVPKFLYYLTQSTHFRLPGEAAMLGAGGQKRVPDLYVKDFEMVWPSKKVQSDVVTFLDTETTRIDMLVAAKQELLEHLKQLQRAAFLSELVSSSQAAPGTVDARLPWLRNVPATWTRCKLKHVVVHFDQGISPQCESRQPEDGEWGVLKVGCINTGFFNPSESKALPPEISPVPEITVERGDLVISRANTRDLIGRCAVVHQDFPNLMLSDKHYRIKLDLDRCYPEFVRLWLWAPWARARIEERANGASPSMLNIDRKTIREMDLVLPRVEDQIGLIERVSLRTEGVRHLQRHAEREIALLQELRTSTITDAVFGQVSTEHISVARRNTKRVAA